jgi:hypothetical protein
MIPPFPHRDSSESHSDAFQRFIKSTIIGQDEWRDGTPYDMNAFALLSPKEKSEAVSYLRERHTPTSDWRDIDVFQAAATTASLAALSFATKAPRAEIRLRAAAALHELKQFSFLTQFLVRELEQITIDDGMVYAFTLMEKPSPEIIAGLLKGARTRPEVATHFAAKVCQLIGKTSSEFDWDMRPFFLRFGEHNLPAEREKAYQELCALVEASKRQP